MTKVHSPDQAGDARPPVALIAGPTASGKSALAIALAQKLRSVGREPVIINADASQVYADIPILSARPSEQEMAGIPHRLFGHADGAMAYNAAQWAADARAALVEAHDREAIPILVGGTGLYLDTLLRGIAPVPAIPEEVRNAVRSLPLAEAYARLVRLDPAAAARLKPQDMTRIARALEVVTATGTPLAVWQQQREGGIADAIALAPLILLPPRDWLRERCDARLAAMFAGGAVTEVERLLERRLDPALPVMNAIGVPQIAEMLCGEWAPADAESIALTLAQRATRQYAKRQYTWFRHQPPADWHRHDAHIDDAEIDVLAIKLRERLLTD